MKRLFFWGALSLGLAAFVWWSKPGTFGVQSQRLVDLGTIEDPAHRGIAIFAFGDFGALSSDTLRTSGAPWKIMVAALALRETGGDVEATTEIDSASLFRRYGFHTPKAIENWPEGLPPPDLATPLGLNTGYAAHGIWPIAATIANTGCAACHSSVVYSADGTPDPNRVWLGTPNGSINLQAYADDVFAALSQYAGDADTILQAVERLFPETKWQEMLTLRRIIAPTTAREIAERDAAMGRLLPFSGGLPGATNGLNALEYRLGLIAPNEPVSESVYNSVPDLGGRVWRRGFLNTNTYAIPDAPRLTPTLAADINAAHLAGLGAIIAYFTVPSMGVSEDVADAHIGDAVDVATWMTEYAPQPFPGQIDADLLPRGRAVYQSSCSFCHGTYDDSLETPALISFPNWLGEIGTDPARIALTGARLADAVNAGPYSAHIAAEAATGYIAPPLAGLWSSAPYFHNGSVPTLWHLMHPDARPERFVVGGHALDLTLVGIAGIDNGAGGWMPPEDYVPWAISEEIDTGAFGLNHDGHEAEFEDLSAEDRAALLEYLKLL